MLFFKYFSERISPMFRASYQSDRVEEVPPGKNEVAGKVRAIAEVYLPSRHPLFISEDGRVPLGVLKSMYMRHRSLWGRYE